MALAAFPYPLLHEPGYAATWLMAVLALCTGDTEEARRLYALCADLPPDRAPAPSRADLLRLWDAAFGDLLAHRPAYHLPILPPSITGLARIAVRPPTGESVLGQIARGDAGGSSEELPAQRPEIMALVVATEWFSRHGGVSTFNRELCVALARAGCRVACLLPAVSAEEQAAAAREGVEIVVAPPGETDGPDTRLLRKPRLPEGFVPNMIVGHGRWTGPAARAQAEDSFPGAARVHIVHTAPGELEWFKPSPGAAARAEEREQQEARLTRGAALVVAVGPRLHRETANLLAGDPVAPPLVRLDPGLRSGERREPPPGIQVLLLGRAEDVAAKGLDIAAFAMARLPHPHPREFESEPILVIRGAPEGTGDGLRTSLLKESGAPASRIRVREYSADQEDLLADLRRASLLLMPSRTEGFGLVGLEAIGSGTPILVSDQSGLGELLVERLGATEALNYVVRTTGALEADSAEWALAIERVLRDRRGAFERAERLRRTLGEALTWQAAVARLIDALPAHVRAGART